MAGFFFCVC